MAMWQSEGWRKGGIVSVEEVCEISVLLRVSFLADDARQDCSEVG